MVFLLLLLIVSLHLSESVFLERKGLVSACNVFF